MAGRTHTVAHSRRISSRPMSLHLRGTSFVDFGQLSKLHTPARARRHFWRILQKSTLVPRTYTRGILCQNSDMILHPDPARPSASSPAPEGGRGSIGDSPRERGGDEPPFGGTVDSWTDVSQNSVKSIDLSPSRARYIVVCQKSDKHDSPLTLTRAVY